MADFEERGRGKGQGEERFNLILKTEAQMNTGAMDAPVTTLRKSEGEGGFHNNHTVLNHWKMSSPLATLHITHQAGQWPLIYSVQTSVTVTRRKGPLHTGASSSPANIFPVLSWALISSANQKDNFVVLTRSFPWQTLRCFYNSKGFGY